MSLLEEQAVSRVQDLVPLRYGRMLVSPFTFFRGAAYLMASDLAGIPHTGLTVQLCGDAHLSNFGTFAAPDRRLVFGLNDFDETLPGPFEWDVKRLVASFAVAGRDRGFDTTQRRSVNLSVVRSYRTAMRDLAQRKRLDVWYARLDVDEVEQLIGDQIEGTPSEAVREERGQGAGQGQHEGVQQAGSQVDGRPRLVSDPPLVVPVHELLLVRSTDSSRRGCARCSSSYRRSLQGDHRHLLEGFQFVEAARKVVGWAASAPGRGSCSFWGTATTTRCSCRPRRPQASVLEPFLGRSKHANHGQRVVEGQRLMQSTSDVLLGWARTDGVDGTQRDFYVRQLWDGKGSAVVEAMKPSAMTAYARVCGWTLARAHARSGDAAAIAAYLGSGEGFDSALADFAESYADQNEQDYAALKRAVESDRITATTG